MGRILDDIRDNCLSKSLSRDHLISKKDIHNIKIYQYNIGGIMKHKNDQISVAAIVNELEKEEDNPILLFKKQGEQDSLNRLLERDFALGIQTIFQVQMMKKFNKDIICVDDTHGTNSYDFYLTTLLVMDEFGEGIPVGWLISNRQDEVVLQTFFERIKENVKVAQPKWFMSDDAEQYFNAWKNVFNTENTKKILCAWHVDRSWRRNLKNVSDTSMQTEVYHQLCMLLQEREESQFRVLLQSFLTYIEEKCVSFYTYFNKHYCNRLEQWATCYRIGTTVNTNMFLESSHRILKIVYLEHKQNRRIDKLLTVLLKIARDKLFQRLFKVEKNKNTHRLCEIRRRHAKCLTLVGKVEVKPFDKNIWTVQSEHFPCTMYKITKVAENCDCQLVCSKCNICVHMFTCTCMDASIHATICKHVHLVIQVTFNPQIESENRMEAATDFSQAFFESRHGKHTAKTNVLTSIDELKLLVENSSSTNLATVHQHIKNAIAILNVSSKELPLSMPVKRKCSTAVNETQRGFFSTKKKR